MQNGVAQCTLTQICVAGSIVFEAEKHKRHRQIAANLSITITQSECHLSRTNSNAKTMSLFEIFNWRLSVSLMVI